MINVSQHSRQPVRSAWTLERLDHECSILLGFAIDSSTATTYSSALNSYLTFCNLHSLPVEPTPKTLCRYIAFQSSFISPSSVDSYLSGICNQLEGLFPEVRANRNSTLVRRTLKGAKRRHGRKTCCKSPLSWDHISTIFDSLRSSNAHDDLLFQAQLITSSAA
jgi:hypothetical protein